MSKLGLIDMNFPRQACLSYNEVWVHHWQKAITAECLAVYLQQRVSSILCRRISTSHSIGIALSYTTLNKRHDNCSFITRLVLPKSSMNLFPEQILSCLAIPTLWSTKDSSLQGCQATSFHGNYFLFSYLTQNNMSQPQIPTLYVKRLTNDLNFVTKPEAFDILPHMQSISGINSELHWTLPGFSFLPASVVLTAARMKTSARRAAVNFRRSCCCCCILGINEREGKKVG